MVHDETEGLKREIENCRLCAERFGATATQHVPRPVVWFKANPKILVAGQAPGKRVHDSGRPFTDPSGDRLRAWMGVSDADFYDLSRIAVVPSAFCFPGYDKRGADLPPPPICARTWHDRVSSALGDVPLKILVGGYALKKHLGVTAPVTELVKDWRSYAPGVFPLPHPSWRNNAWIKRNPWFEAELVPVLQTQVANLLHNRG